MRVYELGKELGTGSHAVIAAAVKLGVEATAPASGLTDAEAAAIRVVLSKTGGDSLSSDGDEPAGAELQSEAQAGYRLVRKGSVSAAHVRVRKGEVVDQGTYAALPARVKKWFERVGV